VLTVNILQEYW